MPEYQRPKMKVNLGKFVSGEAVPSEKVVETPEAKEEGFNTMTWIVDKPKDKDEK